MRRSLQLGIYGLALTGLVAGSTAFAASEKSISLSVDGKVVKVDTHAADVETLLDQRDIELKEHDIVTPSLEADVDEGQPVVVRYGKQLKMTLDGEVREVWVTGATVGEALTELGINYWDARLSVEPAARLARGEVANLELHSSKRVSLKADGRERTVTTTDGTVAELLSSHGIDVSDLDRITPSSSARLTEGTAVVVQRVKVEQRRAEEPLSYKTVREESDQILRGTESVKTRGVNGVQEVIHEVITVDGVVDSERELSRKVLTPPTDQVVVIGTKAPPPPAPSPAGGGGGDTGGLNWDALAQCESGGNWSINTGNGYYGGLQFNISTWLSNGGGQFAQRPDLATREQQIQIGLNLYRARGVQPWPQCGPRLHS